MAGIFDVISLDSSFFECGINPQCYERRRQNMLEIARAQEAAANPKPAASSFDLENFVDHYGKYIVMAIGFFIVISLLDD